MSGPYCVSLALEWFWAVVGLACLLTSAAIALDRRRLESLEQGFVRARGAAPRAGTLAGAAILFIAAAFKWAQYESFQLMDDSASLANVVWNFAHGHGLYSSVWAGRSYFAIHFAFTAVLLAPLMRLWPNTLVLVLGHALAVGTTPIAAFLLARKLIGREVWAWLAGILAFANPQFHWVLESALNSSAYALPAFLWALYFWESRRFAWAAVFVAILATTREQAPCLFFGFGPYILARDRSRRGFLTAAAIMGGSVLLWLGEMSIINRSKADMPDYFNFWGMYAGLGATPLAVAKTAILRPWEIVWEAIHPWSKVRLVAGVLLQSGFMPVTAGPALWPLAAAWAPQQLADANSFFHQLREHYSSLIAGPLIWTSILGIAALLRRSSKKQEALLAAWLLLVSGVDFLRAGTALLPRGTVPIEWDSAFPHARASIPANATLWCDPFLSPHLGSRRFIKVLWRDDQVSFDRGLFVPDRVLLSTHWIELAEPGFRDEILRFLRARDFQPIFREADLIVLAAPGRRIMEDREPEMIAWPPSADELRAAK